MFVHFQPPIPPQKPPRRVASRAGDGGADTSDAEHIYDRVVSASAITRCP